MEDCDLINDGFLELERLKLSDCGVFAQLQALINSAVVIIVETLGADTLLREFC